MLLTDFTDTQNRCSDMASLPSYTCSETIQRHATASKSNHATVQARIKHRIVTWFKMVQIYVGVACVAVLPS